MSASFVRQCISFLLFSLMALGAQAELKIKDGYVRAMPPGQPNTAAFMTLVNTSNKSVSLIFASTDQSAKAEFHTHTVDDKGIMRMRSLESVEIPANGQFEFKPGAHHVMVMGLKQPLKPSQMVKLTLKDTDGNQYDYDLSVKSLIAEKNEQHGHHHHHHH